MMIFVHWGRFYLDIFTKNVQIETSPMDKNRNVSNGQKNLLKMYNLLKKGNTCNNKVFKGGLYEKE